MARLLSVMREAWQVDILGREPLARSGNLWLYLAALILPFGWVFLLLRLQPIRLMVRARRHS